MALRFIADPHAGQHRGFASPTNTPGVNSRLATVLDVLGEVGQHVGRNDHTFILGDLVDTDKPSPQVLTAVMGALDGWPHDRCNTVVMRGNHDSSTPRLGDNALGPLTHAGFSVVEEPRVFGFSDARVVLLSFRPEPPATWVEETLTTLCSGWSADDPRPLLICSHFGLADDDTPEYLREGALLASTAFDLCARFTPGVPAPTLEAHDRAGWGQQVRQGGAVRGAWLSGDWHTRRTWWCDNFAVVQVGALVPTGFDNPGLTGYGSLWTFDDGVLSWRELPGPRFVKYKSAAAALAEPYSETCTLRYAQVTVKADELEAARTELEAGVAAGKLAGFDLIADRNEAIEEAGETAAYVATATSFDAALERAVERLDLAEGVSRGEVLRRARQRLTQGKGK